MKTPICECGRPVITLSRMKHSNGKVIPRSDHDLCQKCWRALADRNREK